MSLKHLLFILLVLCLLSDSDGKGRTKGSKSKKKKSPLLKTAKKIQEQLDPSGILNPSRTSRTLDLAKLMEQSIVNEHVRLSTQLMNWLHRVVDLGQGIANGVGRTVNMI